MEKVVGKLLVATGLLISGSVAFLPLASYATSNTGNIFDCQSSLTNPTGGNATSVSSGVDAAEAPNPCARSNDGSTQINVTVKDILAFHIDDAAGFTDTVGNDKITLFPDMLRYGQLYANVRSAKPYTISLGATENKVTGEFRTALTNADESASIPARRNPTSGVNGWGIAMGQQVELSEIDYDQQYNPLRESPAVFYDSGTGTNDNFTKTRFPVAVSATDKLPQDTYTVDVTITAAVKQ